MSDRKQTSTYENKVNALVKAVLEWWKEHEFDEYGGGDGGIPYNVYNEPPEFVKRALEVNKEIANE